MTNKKTEKLEHVCANVETIRDRFAASGHPLPPVDIVRLAVAGTLNSRTGRMLANPRPFAQDPLGNLLHRMIAFHMGNGNLGGAFGPLGDARSLARPHWQERFPVLTDWTGDYYDQLDTLALVCTGGTSHAADAWGRALGVHA